MNLRRSARMVSAALVLSVAGMASAMTAPPTDAEIDAAIAKFNQTVSELGTPDRTNREEIQAWSQARQEAAKAVFEELNVSELTASQIARLNDNRLRLFHTAGNTEEVANRLEELSKQRDAEGARASVLQLQFLPAAARGATDAQQQEARDAQLAALRNILSHPGLAEAMEDVGGDLLGFFRRADSQVIAQLAPELTRLPAMIGDEPSPQAVSGLQWLVQATLDNDDVDSRVREQIRAESAKVARKALAANEDNTTLERTVAFLDGAYARGQLVGHPAPELNFTWHNIDDKEVQKLSDLKGKVVVLDFWATWCGPCVASFPDVAKLQSHYEGYPVVILGVTSLQGSHISRPEGLGGATERIDTSDDPDKEYALMPEFIDQMDMTWPVAFSKEWVFNPEYGVRGIPHVAIVDPAGKVRFRGIHPSSRVTPWEEKLNMINGLLQEFDLPHPVGEGADAEAVRADG